MLKNVFLVGYSAHYPDQENTHEKFEGIWQKWLRGSFEKLTSKMQVLV